MSRARSKLGKRSFVNELSNVFVMCADKSFSEEMSKRVKDVKNDI